MCECLHCGIKKIFLFSMAKISWPTGALDVDREMKALLEAFFIIILSLPCAPLGSSGLPHESSHNHVYLQLSVKLLLS